MKEFHIKVFITIKAENEKQAEQRVFNLLHSHHIDATIGYKTTPYLEVLKWKKKAIMKQEAEKWNV